jgi:hypothetical protein
MDRGHGLTVTLLRSCGRKGQTLAVWGPCYALRCVKARRWRFGIRVLKHALRSGAGLPTQRFGLG